MVGSVPRHHLQKLGDLVDGHARRPGQLPPGADEIGREVTEHSGQRHRGRFGLGQGPARVHEGEGVPVDHDVLRNRERTGQPACVGSEQFPGPGQVEREDGICQQLMQQPPLRQRLASRPGSRSTRPAEMTAESRHTRRFQPFVTPVSSTGTVQRGSSPGSPQSSMSGRSSVSAAAGIRATATQTVAREAPRPARKAPVTSGPGSAMRSSVPDRAAAAIRSTQPAGHQGGPTTEERQRLFRRRVAGVEMIGGRARCPAEPSRGRPGRQAGSGHRPAASDEPGPGPWGPAW